MRVTYTYEFADYLALIRAAAAGKPVRRHNRIWQNCLWGTSFILALLLLLAVALVLRDTRFSAVSTFFGVALFIFAFWAVERALRKRMLKSLFTLARNANGTVTNEISKDGILSESANMQGLCRWAGITRLVIVPDYMFLFITPLEAFIFPSRGFGSREDFAVAVTFAKAHIPEGAVHGQTL